MISIAVRRTGRKQESTIALINVVFLMLIFFLIAGSLAPPADPAVNHVTSGHDDAAPPPDMLFLRADGSASWRGAPIEPRMAASRWRAEQGSEGKSFRIATDRNLPAVVLLDTLAALRAAGIDNMVLVTERAGQ